MLFNDNSKAFRVFQKVSLTHAFFETDDAGYSIREVYARAAEIKNLPIMAIKDQIKNNFHNCFQH
jgi:Tat protein secretion system quality control protein TatD with DNase activity